MARIKVLQDTPIVITEAGASLVYKVKDGVIEVDEAHVGAILGAVAGSELQPESPAITAKSESPTKEK